MAMYRVLHTRKPTMRPYGARGGPAPRTTRKYPMHRASRAASDAASVRVVLAPPTARCGALSLRCETDWRGWYRFQLMYLRTPDFTYMYRGG